MAQFMLRKTWPKNMRTKAPTTPFDTAVPNAEKMNGAEIKSPTPQITEKLARFDLMIIFLSHMKWCALAKVNLNIREIGSETIRC